MSNYNKLLEEGKKFEDFVCIELYKVGFIIQGLNSYHYQKIKGENLQGIEIKLDNRCTDTNRLSIEIAERSSIKIPFFTPSGIYREDNTWLYIQGNYNCIWIFSKNMLKLLHSTNRYKSNYLPTLKAFFLPVEEANKYAAKKIIF